MTPTAPPRAAILSIGDELVLGQTLDTNSQWLSQRLLDAGCQVAEHVTLPDDLDAMVETLRRLTATLDVVVITGGLGPTADDLTRDALAALLGEPLVEDAGAVEHLRQWFIGRPMPEANLVQARRPRSATCIPNPHGTALGLAAAHPGPNSGDGHTTLLFCLPGPPREMRPMLEAHVLPRLARPGAPALATRVLPTFGLGESEVARRLGPLMDRDRAARGLPLVGTTASQGVVSIRIRATGARAAIQAAVDDACAECRRLIGDEWILGEGEISLAASILDLLRTRGQTLAVAESCTGGLLGSMLTEIAGSSDAVLGGWITYANAMKTAQLGVPPDILATHGAVSRACAEAMARGALRSSGASHALAITGIAGPGGGTDTKPVGTVWIGLASTEAPVIARRFLLMGDRGNIRSWAAQSALGMLRLRLIGREDIALMRQSEA